MDSDMGDLKAEASRPSVTYSKGITAALIS